jgi:arginase family enzyme
MGLINPPLYAKEVTTGVEEAPDAILTEKFLEKFPESIITHFDFPYPETLQAPHYDTSLASSLKECASMITQSILPNTIQVVIGGDHSVTFSSMLALLERHENPSTIGYIQFDSHADMNLRIGSPTNNFHGMYLRALLDEQFDIPEVKEIIPSLLDAKNMLFIGNLDLDHEERSFFQEKQITSISRKMLIENKEKALTIFKNFTAQYSHLHVTFDIDCLDKTIALATGIPSHDGLFLNDIEEMLRVIASHPSFSFDIAEVNPKKIGSEMTIVTAQSVLAIVLSSTESALF